MRAVAQQLPHRLERQPSLAAELREAAIMASVPVFIGILGAWGFATSRKPAPGWVWIALPLFALVTLSLLVSLAIKARRALSGRAPVVEVDAQPCRPGQAFQVRVVVDDADALDGLEVFLVATGLDIQQVRATASRDSRWRFTEAVKHQVPLLSVPGEALRAAAPFDRIVSATVPVDAGAGSLRWHVQVVGLAGRGVPRLDGYPLRVEA